MIKIYHNPRCSKSRQGLQILEDAGKEFTIVKYLEEIPSAAELKDAITKLGITPLQLIRKNEAIWKQEFKNKELTDEQLINAMIANPKLIERPIVIKGNKAVLGRPPENITNLISN